MSRFGCYEEEQSFDQKRRRHGVYLSPCVLSSIALVNVFLLVACISLSVHQWETRSGVEVHRYARQFAGAGPDRQPGSRDPEPGEVYTTPGEACCSALDPNTLQRICESAMPTAQMPLSTTTVSTTSGRLRRQTPTPTPTSTSSSLLSSSSSPSSSTSFLSFNSSASSSSSISTTTLSSTSTGPKSYDALDNLRLPRHLQPYHYDIWWRPDFYSPSPDKFTLNGSVSIYFRCQSPSAVISLNYRRLLIDTSSIKVVRIQDNVLIPWIRVSDDVTTEVYNITLGQGLAVGEEIEVRIKFVAFLENGPTGIYWSEYVMSNNTRRYLVSTQMETTEARRAFPCVDDPAAKATFTISVDRRSGMKTLANTPINFTIASDLWYTDVFETTKPMSTYLIAFVVSDYTGINVTSNGSTHTPIGLWTQDDFRRAGYIDYASIVAPVAVEAYEDYFNYSFKWPKLDMAAVPKMSFGGMENWGMITYQLNRFLFDKDQSDTLDKLALTVTNTHEIFHNWLGNTVTIKWWDDLWLTEGMARYFQFLGTQKVHQTWDIEQLFMELVFYAGAMWNDDSGSADPVYNPELHTNSDLESMFSAITYDKGATVIRMLSKLIVGEDIFRDAMKKYVSDFQYGNVDHNDLFDEMAQAIRRSSLKQDFDISEVLSTWIKQSGFPLVTVTRGNASSTQLNFFQKLYLYQPDAIVEETYPSPYGYLWEIPVTYITSLNSNPVKFWMHKENETRVTLTQPLTVNDWILVNYNVYGYYRVNYDDAIWLALAAQLKTDHKKIPVNNRAQLIEDSFTLAMSGNLPQLIGIQLTEYLTNETEYLPWTMFMRNMDPLRRRVLTDDSLYTQIQNYIRSRLQSNYDTFGWDSSPDDNVTVTFLRRLILQTACETDHQNCVNGALNRFRAWQVNGLNNSALNPDIRFPIYCTVAANGNHEDWEALVTRYQATLDHFSGESSKLVVALTCTRDNATITRMLQSIQLQNTSIVSWRDYNNVLYYIARSKQGYSASWDHLYRYGTATLGRVDILKSFSDVISTPIEAAKFDAYVTQYPAQNDYERESFSSHRQRIQQNIVWRQRNERDIRTWLNGLGF